MILRALFGLLVGLFAFVSPVETARSFDFVRLVNAAQQHDAQAIIEIAQDKEIKLAQGGMAPGPGTVHSAGGGSPTIGGGAAWQNASCGFASSCNITTTGTVTTGTVVAIAGVNNQGGSAGTLSISVCGTSLTMDVQPTINSGAYGAAMGHGTVTGGAGSCTISITISAGGNIQNGAVALVTLNSLASSTPDTSCQAFYNVSQNSPFPCTGGLTVSGSGFGVVGYYDNQTTTPANGGSLTVDATAGNGTAPTQQVAIGHVTATCTAAQCQYTGTNFAQASVIGESFH